MPASKELSGEIAGTAGEERTRSLLTFKSYKTL